MWWHSLENHQAAVTDGSRGDHDCSSGCRQGEHLARGLSDGNLMTFSSTSVWDVKDVLVVRAGWKFSSGTFLPWKTLILQNWNVSQEHADSIGSFNGKQAGCPGSLYSWSHASLGSPGSHLPRQLLLQLPDTLTRPLPRDWAGWGQGNMKQRGTGPQVGSLAAVSPWKFSFLYMGKWIL